MVPDLLLNFDNLGPELRFAPHNVTSYLQVESVEMGEGRNRNESDNKKKGKDQKTRRPEDIPDIPVATKL